MATLTMPRSLLTKRDIRPSQQAPRLRIMTANVAMGLLNATPHVQCICVDRRDPPARPGRIIGALLLAPVTARASEGAPGTICFFLFPNFAGMFCFSTLRNRVSF